MINQGRVDEFEDFWDASDSRPIHVKETAALLKALLSVKHEVKTKGSIYIVIIKLLFVHGIIKVLRILRTIVFYVRCGPISHMLRAPEVWV